MPANIVPVQRVSTNSPVSTSVSATITAATAGNKLIAVMKENGSNAVTTPAGFTHVAGSPYTGGAARQLYIMWKDAAGGETSVSFSNADSNNKLLTVWEVSGLEAGAEVYADGTTNATGVTSKTLDASGTLANADNFFIAVADQALDNGGTEAVNGSWTIRDTGTFNFWTIADLITSATTSLNPQFTWTTARASMGFMAGWRAYVAETGTATLSGSGTLGATGTASTADTAALTGSGTITAAGAPAIPRSVTLSGSGTLGAVGVAEVDVVYEQGDAFPALKVWQDLNDGTWGLVGDFASYETLDFTERFLAPGDWEMRVTVNPDDPDDLKLLTLFTPDRLVTIDWRGHRTTWGIEQWNPARTSEGRLALTVAGPSTYGDLSWELAWPDPTAGLDAQPDKPILYGSGSGGDDAETTLRALIKENWNDRRGESLVIPTNAHQGDSIRVRGRFDSIAELVSKKAKVGGIGVDMGLENLSSARAAMKLRFWEPADRSNRVQLSERVGSVSEFSQNNQAPTMTKALVAGVGANPPETGYTAGRYKIVTTADSIAQAAAWRGHRVGYVSGPQSYDDDDLQQAGEDALADAAQTTNVTLTATDAEGLMAFTHYNVGDKVKGVLITGLDVLDVITSIKVSVAQTGYPDIASTFGDPNADDEMVSMGELVKVLSRRIRQLEQRSQ